MTPSWLVISAYSINTPYEAEAAKLYANLVEFDIPFRFYPYKSRGNWALNCEYNGEILIRALHEHNCNIVWLDVDATVYSYPKLFDDYKYDIGLYRRLHTPEHREATGINYHWDTGTGFYRRVPKVIKALEEQQKKYKLFDVSKVEGGLNTGWLLEDFNNFIDRLVLDKPILKEDGISIGVLPVTYSYIFNTKQPEEIKYKRKVVIKHHQASRRFKDVIR